MSTLLAAAPTTAIFLVVMCLLVVWVTRKVVRDARAEYLGGPEADSAGMSPQQVIKQTRRAEERYNTLARYCWSRDPKNFRAKEWAEARCDAERLVDLCRSMETLLKEK